MIRKVTPKDEEEIVELIREFFDEEISKRGIAFDRFKVIQDFRNFVDNPAIMAFCIDNNGKIDGFIALIIARRPFFGELSANELIWYVRKPSRREGLKLLKHIEKICDEIGCKNILMIGLKDTKAEKVYHHLGYKTLETVFLKQLRRG